jgi:RNA polymerase sigma factor (sigma-70 family)
MLPDENMTEFHAAPAPLPDQQGTWFAKEVQPHGPLLRSYLRQSFPAVRDVDDMVQESFLRIWKAHLSKPIQSTRAFLFKVARHLALDFVRRQRVSPIDPVRDLSTLDVIEESRDASALADTREKIRVLADAVALLPARCREIIILRKFQNLSQKEVAVLLGISERTVEVQVARGVKRCESHLRRWGINSLYGNEK